MKGKFVGQSFIIFLLIPLVLSIGILPTLSFAEQDHLKCRIQVSADQSLDPIEKFFALDRCYGLYDEEHRDCMRSIPRDTSLTFVEKKIALKECASKKPNPYIYEKDEYLHVAEQIIDFCDYFYPTHLLTNEIEFFTVVKHPYARPCLLLYADPIWNYTGTDRATALVNHLHDKTLEHLEKTKEERMQSVEDARISQSRIMFLEDLFKDQKKKTEFLENQLEEKDKLIAKNDVVIQEQLNVIDEFKKKNIILTSTIGLDTENKIKLQECLENEILETLTFIEKYKTIQECTKTFNHIPVAIDNSTITIISKKIIQGCQDWYPAFLILSERKFIDAVKKPIIKVCVLLYKAPVWSYEGADRSQVMLDVVESKVEEYLNEHKDFRETSVYNAFTTSGRYMIVPQIFEFGEEKIEVLEKQIEEKDKIITKQNAIILEQVITIKELYNKITNTGFKKI